MKNKGISSSYTCHMSFSSSLCITHRVTSISVVFLKDMFLNKVYFALMIQTKMKAKEILQCFNGILSHRLSNSDLWAQLCYLAGVSKCYHRILEIHFILKYFQKQPSLKPLKLIQNSRWTFLKRWFSHSSKIVCNYHHSYSSLPNSHPRLNFLQWNYSTVLSS